MESYEDLWLSKCQRPITTLECYFQEFQKDTAISMLAKQNYQAMKSKRNVSNEEISITRSSYRNALLNLQATAQRLYNKAANDGIFFYQEQANKSIEENKHVLDKLNTSGSRRKRNKSRIKVYSAHKKSKRRRVKSTRRRHKKSTIHHRRKY